MRSLALLLTVSTAAAYGNEVLSLPFVYFDENSNFLTRMGELRLQNVCGYSPGGVWLRGFGQKGDFSSFKNRTFGGEFGVDSCFWEQLYAGVVFGFSETGTFICKSKEGGIHSLFTGLYLSWVEPSGWYIDLAWKLNSFKCYNRYFRDNWRHYGTGLSLESGYRFCFFDFLVVEPELQLAHFHLTGSQRCLNKTFLVDILPSENLQFRASLLTALLIDGGSCCLYEPYMRLSFIQQSGSNPAIKGSVFDLNIGVAMQGSPLDQVYMSCSTAVGKNYSFPWSLYMGFRHSY